MRRNRLLVTRQKQKRKYFAKFAKYAKIVFLDDVGILRSLSCFKIVVKIDSLQFSYIFTQRPHKNEVIG